MKWQALVVGLLACGALALAAQAQDVQGGSDDGARSVPPGAADAEQAAVSRFLEARPDARLYRAGDRITRVYGTTFEFGESPQDTAERFVSNNARMFGVAVEDLEPVSRFGDRRHVQPVMPNRETGDYKFALVSFSQYKDGLPVFRSEVRCLILNQQDYPLTLVIANLRNLGEFTPNTSLANAPFDPATSVATGMTNLSAPEAVIWAGVDDRVVEPVVAFTFIGDNYETTSDPAEIEKWLYVVDAATGEILYQEDMILDVDMTGNVSGYATDDYRAEVCEAEVLMPMPYALVSIQGGDSAYADENGDFVIPHDGSSPVDVTSEVRGLYFNVNNQGSGGDASITLEDVVPPGPANFVHNSGGGEIRTAEMNGYIHANIVRDNCLAANPSYPTIASQTNWPVNVNLNDNCNAFYDYSSINFFTSGGGCNNTAFGDVVHHEYGHHMVSTGGSGQGQYGEGMGDCQGVLITGRSELGVGFQNCFGGIRDADNDMQYPCSGAIHYCGQLISGCVWDLQEELMLTEPTDWYEILNDLVVNSILLHTGTLITPQITIDFLTLDDDDGGIGNGTPHWDEICAGFGAHNMDCPPLDVGMSVAPTSDFDASGDPGGPFTPDTQIYTIENLGPDPVTFEVTASVSWLTVTDGIGSLPDVGDMAEVTISINDDADTLPVGRHSGTISFINTATGIGNTTRQANLAVGIPDDCTSAWVVCPGTYSDSTVDMTNDGSASCGSSDSTPDMWFSYLPDSDGTATFSLCTGTSYDSVLSVHSGCPGTSANELGCDDDYCGGGGPSQVTISVTGGNTYLIRVTGWNGATGSFTLTFTGPDCIADVLSISFPDGLHEYLEPSASTTFTVQIEDGLETYVPDSGLLHYRYDGGTFLTSPLTSLGGDLYQATLPAADCGDTPEYYLSAEGSEGSTVVSPEGAPANNSYAATVGTLTIILEDNFETDQGWTVEDDPSLTDGGWERGVPVGLGERFDPPTDYDGAGQCYLTANRYGNSDVDGGPTWLISPRFDLSGGSEAVLKYSRWWRNDDQDGDPLDVEISVDDGASWTLIERVLDPEEDPAEDWAMRTVFISDYVTPTSEVRIRFSASDVPNNSIDEAGIDAFFIASLSCSEGGCAQLGDLNDDTFVNGDDIGQFVSCCLDGDPAAEGCACADLIDDGILDLADVQALVDCLVDGNCP
jgi:hypothetical protein